MLLAAVVIRACEEFAANEDEKSALDQESDDHHPQEVLAFVDRVTAHPEPEEHSCSTDEHPCKDAEVPLTFSEHVREVVEEEGFLRNGD